MRSTRVLAVVSHSLGELDVLLPLFAALKSRKDLELIIIFSVFKVWRGYLRSNFFRQCALELNVKCRLLWLPNKFDVPKGPIASRVYRLLGGHFGASFIGARTARTLSKLVSNADFILHESTTRPEVAKVIYPICSGSEQRVLVYHHGHSLNQVSKKPKKRLLNKEALFLLFDPQNQAWAREMGFENQTLIGFPKFEKNWKKFVDKYVERERKVRNTNHVVIFVRGWDDHEYYMQRPSFEEMIKELHDVVRQQLGATKIIIKPHPRQKVANLKKVLKRLDLSDLSISMEHPAVLAAGAQLAISMWTSCVFDSLIMGVLTVEYFREPPRFREMEPKGSLYPLVGIPSATNPIELKLILDSHIGKTRSTLPITDIWKNRYSAQTIDQLFAKSSLNVVESPSACRG